MFLHECHEPGNESVAGPFEDVEEGSKERSTKDECQSPTLDQIGDEELEGGFIEAVFLFEDEGLVDGEGQCRERRQEEESEDEAN
jgi:hypothetical protein